MQAAGQRLLIASHRGLWISEPGRIAPERVSEKDYDMESLLLQPDDRYLASGHPSATGAALPEELGLIESLARLFDRDQDVAGPVAGTAPAAFGVVVRDSRGARVFATQVGRASIGRTPSLRLMRGNRAMSAAGSSGKVHAGSFNDL